MGNGIFDKSDGRGICSIFFYTSSTNFEDLRSTYIYIYLNLTQKGRHSGKSIDFDPYFASCQEHVASNSSPFGLLLNDGSSVEGDDACSPTGVDGVTRPVLAVTDGYRRL